MERIDLLKLVACNRMKTGPAGSARVHSRWAGALLVLAAALSALVGSATPAHAAGGSGPPAVKGVATFGTQTAGATKADGRTYFDFAATPGAQLLDHLAVINYSAQPISLSIQGVDAVNTPQGGVAARPVNEASRDIGRWIEVRANDTELQLPARSSVIIPFLVSVPRNATPGDHVGAITATLQSSVISRSGQRVKLLQTAGTRIFLRVSGPLHPQLAIEHLTVHYHGTLDPIGRGSAELTYTVSNVGNVALGGRQTVSVSGLFGARKVAVHVREVQLLLPGYSVAQSVPLTGILPEGRDTGRVSITPLVVPGSAQPSSGPFVATVAFWAVPWTLLALMAAIILLVAGLLLLRRRRRRKTSRPRGPKAPGGGPGSGAEARTAAHTAGSAEDPVAALAARPSAPTEVAPT